MFWNFASYCAGMLDTLRSTAALGRGGGSGNADDGSGGGAKKKARRGDGDAAALNDSGKNNRGTSSDMRKLLDTDVDKLDEHVLVRCTLTASVRALQAFSSFADASSGVRRPLHRVADGDGWLVLAQRTRGYRRWLCRCSSIPQ
jgi:hypothetical protein